MDQIAPLPEAFFARHTVTVAKDLLGMLLLREQDGQCIATQIVETEAYHGKNDRASHAHRGQTPRNAIMFDRPGLAYVYQIYGVWFCLNVSTVRMGFPGAVLIRALAPFSLEAGADPRHMAGPGKLTRALSIDRELNGIDLTVPGPLWLGVRTGTANTTNKIRSGPRIGIDYAGKCTQRNWRFWIDSHPAVSR